MTIDVLEQLLTDHKMVGVFIPMHALIQEYLKSERGKNMMGVLCVCDRFSVFAVCACGGRACLLNNKPQQVMYKPDHVII